MYFHLTSPLCVKQCDVGLKELVWENWSMRARQRKNKQTLNNRATIKSTVQRISRVQGIAVSIANTLDVTACVFPHPPCCCREIKSNHRLPLWLLKKAEPVMANREESGDSCSPLTPSFNREELLRLWPPVRLWENTSHTEKLNPASTTVSSWWRRLEKCVYVCS